MGVNGGHRVLGDEQMLLSRRGFDEENIAAHHGPRHAAKP